MSPPPETSLPAAHVAVAVTVAGDGAPIAGTVRLITPLVDVAKRATGVRISLDRKGRDDDGAFAGAPAAVASGGGSSRGPADDTDLDDLPF